MRIANVDKIDLDKDLWRFLYTNFDTYKFNYLTDLLRSVPTQEESIAFFIDLVSIESLDDQLISDLEDFIPNGEY